MLLRTKDLASAVLLAIALALTVIITVLAVILSVTFTWVFAFVALGFSTVVRAIIFILWDLPRSIYKQFK